MSEIISSLLEYFFATSESIFEFISKIQNIFKKNTPASTFSVKSQRNLGQEVTPFSMDWGMWQVVKDSAR